MKRCCVTGAIIYALLISSAVAAESAYVLRDDGLYVLSPTSMSLVKVPFIDQRTGAVPGPNPIPNPPTDPPADPPVTGVRAEAERQARKVNDPKGAAWLGATYAVFAKELASGGITPVSARKELGTVRTIAFTGIGVGSKDRWADFTGVMDAAMGQATNDKLVDYFRDVRDGLAAAAGVDPRAFDTMVSSAKLHSRSADDAIRAATESLDSGEVPEKFLEWLPGILDFIVQIINLLRDLGILK